MKKITFYFMLLTFLAFSLQGQGKKSKNESKEKKEKTFDDIIGKDAKSDEGLFNIHEVKDKFYYEIPDTLLGKKCSLVTRIAKTANGLGFGEWKTKTLKWFDGSKNAIKLFCIMYLMKMWRQTVSLYTGSKQFQTLSLLLLVLLLRQKGKTV